jgi:hypothetical protein
VIDTETVKAKVRSDFLKVAGVEIDFDHMILDFFPRPHVIIDRVELAIPPAVKGKAALVTVRPKLLHTITWQKRSSPFSPVYRNLKYRIWNFGLATAARICLSATGKSWSLRRLIPIWKALPPDDKSQPVVNPISGNVYP